MRKMLAALVVAFLLFPMERGRAQSGASLGGILFAPNSVRSVTLSKNGVPLASLNVPKGTALSASYDNRQSNSITGGRWEFHGDFALRALPATELASRPSGERAEQTMSRAPLVLTAQGVDVMIENVP
jgi:hypothetical protein